MSTPKEETILSKEWIANLFKSVSLQNERIKLIKIHGGAFQEWGIPDYTGCFHGKYLAIEFKVAPNEPTDRQVRFLVDIIECEGVSMIVNFHKRPAIATMSDSSAEYYNKEGFYVRGQEYLTVLKAFEGNKNEFHYNFIY